jgi:hypothetical protein
MNRSNGDEGRVSSWNRGLTALGMMREPERLDDIPPYEQQPPT